MSHIDTHSFLTKAVSALPLDSSTSAHLLTVQTQLLHEQSKTLNVLQKRDHCGACGSIRKPQWSKVTEVKPKRKALTAGRASTGATVYKCLRCCQRTVLPSHKRQRNPVSKPPSRAATVTSSRASTPVGADMKGSKEASTDPKSGDNQNSRKRAKSRKQGGLQALLASKQRAQPSLDLLDFLQ